MGEDFLVCYGDYVINRRLSDGKTSPQLNLSDIIKHHKSSKKKLDTMMTVALTEVERKAAVRFGVAQLEEVNGFDLIRGFTEKPDMKDIPERPTINAGIYVIDSDFILSNIDKYLPDKPNTSFEKNLLETLAKDKKSRLVAYILDLDAWFDVGTLEQLIDTNLYIASRKDVKRQKGPCDS